MTKSPRLSTRQTTAPISTNRAIVLLIATALDTTWRAFVPTIGGTFIGIGLDKLFNKAPLFTIILIIIGFLTSALLIILQIKRIRKSR